MVLLLSAFWDTDPFTAELVHSFTLENFQRIIETPVYRDVAWRTIQMAVLVTLADIVLAFPIAYYMARVASPRTRNLLVIAVLMPLWANYLVKAYAWRTILSEGGIVNWALAPLGLSFDGYSTVGLWLVFTYLWLPFMILPVYAGLERIPSSLFEASADLGGRSLRDVPPCRPAARLSCGRRGLDLHVLAHPRRLHRARAHHERAVHRHGHLQHPRSGASHGRRLLARPDRRRDRVPPRRPQAEGVRVAVTEPRLTRWLLRLGTGLTLAFIYGPLVVIALYAFNRNVTQAWPIEKFSTRWFSVAFEDEAVRKALTLSVVAALGATAIALVLGTLASLAVARYRFFGREVITFAVILPIALPGIVTGLALQATIIDVLGPLGVSFGLATIIVGHATFCVVVVYNNVIARMRRTAGSLDEASVDLGADYWQTFRYVLFPQLRTALLAGGLLAFALSFDEVVVTIFTSGAEQTLPIWIFATLSRPAQLPIVNVVALFVIVASIIPVYVAQRLAGGGREGDDRARPVGTTAVP